MIRRWISIIEETDKDFNDDEFIGEFTSNCSSRTTPDRYLSADHTDDRCIEFWW